MLNKLESAIQKDSLQHNGEVFQGANLVISNDPTSERYDHDVFVFSPYAEEISWVVFQLQIVFEDHICWLNKSGFYPALGKAANKAIQDNLELYQVLQAMVEMAKDFWSNRKKV